MLELAGFERGEVLCDEHVLVGRVADGKRGADLTYPGDVLGMTAVILLSVVVADLGLAKHHDPRLRAIHARLP